MRSQLLPLAQRLRKNVLLVISLVSLITGCIMLAGSRPFVGHFLTRKGANVMLQAKITTYRRLEELVDTRAQSSAAKIRLRIVDRVKDDVFLLLSVDAGTTEDSINEANRLTKELRSDFEQQYVQPPSVPWDPVPVAIVNRSHRVLWMQGWIAGAALLGLSIVMAIVHYVKVRRQTPPPLPGQENRGDDTTTYDY
jgi:hypothetical protein